MEPDAGMAGFGADSCIHTDLVGNLYAASTAVFNWANPGIGLFDRRHYRYGSRCIYA